MPRISEAEEGTASTGGPVETSAPPHPAPPAEPDNSPKGATAVDQCAQCHAVGVPLLAPDEPLGQSVPISPATKAKPR